MPRRFENRAEVETERLAKSDFRFSRAALLCMRAALPAALALGVSWSSEAVAQTTTSNTTITIGPNVGRRLPGADVGSEYHYRDARRWWINYDECLADEYFDFPIAVSNPKNRFEVWAGNGEDCGQKRSLQDMGQCWIVYSNDRPTDNFTASIPVRNIVAHIEDTVDVPMGVGQDVCEQSTDSDGLSVKLYFFISDGGTIVGTEKIWDPTNLGGLGFDLVGPEPPGNITLGMGENQLSVNLDNVQDEPDRERFAAFWALVDDCLAPDGQVFFADDAYRTPDELIEGPASSTIRRRLRDGSTYRAVKVPHTPQALERRLAELGWDITVSPTAGPFFWGAGGRAKPGRTPDAHT